MSFELEYAGKRLAHYRQTVSSGRLKAFLETFMAGVRLQGAQVALAFVPIVRWLVTSVISFKLLSKKQLTRLAALPWNADDLPRFDEDFLAAQKARQQQQAKGMGIML